MFYVFVLIKFSLHFLFKCFPGSLCILSVTLARFLSCSAGGGCSAGPGLPVRPTESVCLQKIQVWWVLLVQIQDGETETSDLEILHFLQQLLHIFCHNSNHMNLFWKWKSDIGHLFTIKTGINKLFNRLTSYSKNNNKYNSNNLKVK